MTRALPAAAFILCLLPAVLAGRAGAADESAPLVIDGRVKQVQHLTAADLRAMPAVEREVAFQTDGGERKARYRGVLLWAVIERAGIDDPAKKWGDLRHVIAVTAKDGYLVMFSLGEIDPNFGNAPIMIAYGRNGEPLAGGALRLVVPGDTHGARDVRDVTHIDVR